MKLHALLIGINNYPVKPLGSCIKDVEKVESYLNSLTPFFEEIHITPVLNEKADKDSIVELIKTVLGAAGDDDVALFYFSGHGAQEHADGRFPTEQAGLLECLVCHYTKEQETGFLLADKEIRYLLSGLENSPHLVTLFDCCHSGEIVRSAMPEEEQGMVRRLIGYFDARPYSEFLFYQDIPEEKLRQEGLAKAIPFKNHVHLAACSSGQSAWEDSKGGVFTRYLLQLLKATNNRITYQEISRWAKISLKGITRKQQTPTFSIQKKGKIHALSGWLNLSVDESGGNGYIIFNENKGWYYSRGELMGIKPGLKLEVTLENERSFSTVVKTVEPELALIDVPLTLRENADPAKRYEVVPESIYSPVSIFVNDLDLDPVTAAEVRGMVKAHKNVGYTDDPAMADYFVNIFNQLLYISLPELKFCPLAEQIDLMEISEMVLRKVLHHQLDYVVKWHHFDTLENPGKDFDKTPLKIEIQLSGTNEWVEISESNFDLLPQKNEQGEQLKHRKFKLRITNVTAETLHVGALNLFSDFEIDANPFDGMTIELAEGKSKVLYDHEADATRYIALEPYMEVYNWPVEFWNFTFIVNNFEEFTSSMKDFIQPELSHPLIIDPKTKELLKLRGGGPGRDLEPVVKKWGTVRMSLHLINTKYNIVTGDLQKLWKEYTENEKLAPFIGQLYLEERTTGLYRHSYSKPNGTGVDENTRSLGAISVYLGNKIEDKRRWRTFKKARDRMIDQPVIVAEGDSWFLYPFFVKDTLDYVMEHFPVRSIAAAGAELENYKNHGNLLKEVATIRPSYVLISGGGNDIVGEEVKELLHEHVPPGESVDAYVNENFTKSMNQLEELYKYFFAELKKQNSVRQVFVHGYAYVQASEDPKILKKGWVNRHMRSKGITRPEDRQRVSDFLLNTFNDMLKRITVNNPLVTYLDMRDQVEPSEWYDEIHPTDIGFEKVGRKFVEAIQKFENLG